MSYLTKLITKKISEVIKNTATMEIIIQSLIDEFKDQCPPKPELLLIVKQKNQIQSGLEQVVAAFEPVNTIAETTETLVTTVSSAIKVIKSIPVPVAVMGVGIPINAITILADSLDILGDLLKSAKGSVSLVPGATKIISSSATSVISQLTKLDVLFNKCIEELIIEEGLDQQGINDLALEINNIAATSGNFANDNLNSSIDEELLGRLSPNSLNPYLYKDFTFEIQYELNVQGENIYSFPRRRIRVSNNVDTSNNIYFGVALFNIVGGKYSGSSSVEVLINEAKFRIDSLDYNYYFRLWFDLNSDIESEDPGGRIEDDGSTPPPSEGLTPSQTINFPTPITLTPTPLEDFISVGVLGESILRGVYAPNPYKQIPYSIDIGRAVQATGNNMEFPISNSLMLTAEVYVPNTELTFTLDTGEFTPKIVAGNSSPGWGIYDPSEGSIPYDRGYAKLKINAASGSVSQYIKYLEGNREIVSYSFVYPTVGTYNVQVELLAALPAALSPSTSIRANTSSSLIISYDNQ
tara:strand:+ start:912 stop:2480 length:1569 start_codon:yes stop_codon:yes gene_type:complete